MRHAVREQKVRTKLGRRQPRFGHRRGTTLARLRPTGSQGKGVVPASSWVASFMATSWRDACNVRPCTAAQPVRRCLIAIAMCAGARSHTGLPLLPDDAGMALAPYPCITAKEGPMHEHHRRFIPRPGRLIAGERAPCQLTCAGHRTATRAARLPFSMVSAEFPAQPSEGRP